MLDGSLVWPPSAEPIAQGLPASPARFAALFLPLRKLFPMGDRGQVQDIETHVRHVVYPGFTSRRVPCLRGVVDQDRGKELIPVEKRAFSRSTVISCRRRKRVSSAVFGSRLTVSASSSCNASSAVAESYLTVLTPWPRLPALRCPAWLPGAETCSRRIAPVANEQFEILLRRHDSGGQMRRRVAK